MLKFRRAVIAVIGCGGTGSYFSDHLGRLLGGYGELRRHNPQAVLLIDADVVSQSNTARQNFSYREIGMQKGLVLANRLQQSHQVQNVDFWGSYANSRLLDKIMVRTEGCPAIFVSCVDNHDTRNRIMSRLKPDYNSWDGARQSDWLYLDAGNATHEGWVSAMGVFGGVGFGCDMRQNDAAMRNNTGQTAPTLDQSGREQRGCGATTSSPETYYGNQQNSYLLASQLRSILLKNRGFGVCAWQRCDMDADDWQQQAYQNHFLAPFELT
jgi:hypothetical protein